MVPLGSCAALTLSKINKIKYFLNDIFKKLLPLTPGPGRSSACSDKVSGYPGSPFSCRPHPHRQQLAVGLERSPCDFPSERTRAGASGDLNFRPALPCVTLDVA